MQLEKSGGIFSKDFDLLHDGVTVCTMSFTDWKFVQFAINARQHIVRAGGRGRWQLESAGVVTAECTRQGTGRDLSFSIDFDPTNWLLKPRIESMKLVHDICEGDLVVGRIDKKIGLWKSGLEVVLPEAARLEIISFAVWLIGIHWVGAAGKLTPVRAQVGL